MFFSNANAKIGIFSGPASILYKNFQKIRYKTILAGNEKNGQNRFCPLSPTLYQMELFDFDYFMSMFRLNLDDLRDIDL